MLYKITFWGNILLDCQTRRNMQYQKTVLSQALQKVVNVAPMKPTLPVLRGVKIDTTIGKTRFTATDFDTFISTTIESDTTTETSTVLPARMLHNIVNALPAKPPVNISVNGENARITGGKSTYTMRTMEADGFPNIDPLDSPVGTVVVTDFAHALGLMKPFVSADTTLAALNCVNIVAVGETLTFEATDRFRATTITIPWSPASPDVMFTAAVPGAQLFKAASTLGIGDITLHFDEQRFGWETNDTNFTIRLSAADFPNLEPIMRTPGAHTTVVKIKDSDLQALIKRVEVTQNQLTTATVTINPGVLAMSSQTDDADGGTEAETTTHGEPQSFGINTKLLKEVISTMAGNVGIAITEPGRPIHFYEQPDVVEVAPNKYWVTSTQTRQTLMMPVRIK